MSEITLNITLHSSNCNRLPRHFIPWWLLIMNINAQIIFFPLQKLIAITIVFHISYQCAIMTEITDIALFYLKFITKSFSSALIAHNKHQCTNHFLCFAEINYNDNCFSQIIPMWHLSEIILKITLHSSNSNRLLTHFIP